ncbi:hypothetical protein WJX74_000197 [Apatococcus lobatus]|uniref:Uncharacterized protein n=1 Tax=Apatococcus lobatus TaxID=904363 RepID=A0AAW1RVX3_9CHLO
MGAADVTRSPGTIEAPRLNRAWPNGAAYHVYRAFKQLIRCFLWGCALEQSAGGACRGSSGPRRSSRQNGYSSERSQTRPPPTRSSSRSGRPDSYVHDWARQQSQTRQDRYSESRRHQRDPREYRERERDRTPSQRGYARDPRERYPSRSRSRYEGDYRDSREGPMSRSASHTSLASFGPGNPNPYASKPKQRIRPKAPEPPKRAALASPEPAKKIELKDGLTTPSPTPGKKKWGLSMFRISRGDGKDGEAAAEGDPTTPEDDGVPGIDTPDGVDRGATGSLPREGPKALEGPSTDAERSPDGSAAGPDGHMDGHPTSPLEQDSEYRPEGRQHRPNRSSAAAAQRRSRSGALEHRAHSGLDERRGSGYDDRRGGYDDRRGPGGYDERRGGGYEDRRGGGYEDRRNGYEERSLRSPAQRVVPKARAVPSTPKLTPVDTDKLATPASFGKKPVKPAEATAAEDKVPAPPTPKRSWFGWGFRRTSSSKVLEDKTSSTDIPTADSGVSAKAAAPAASGPLANGLMGNPQVGAPKMGPLSAGPTSPSTSGSSSDVTGYAPSSPMTSPFAAASKSAASNTRQSSNYDSMTATTPGGVSYTSLYPKKPSVEAPPQPAEGAETSKADDAEIAAELAREEAAATSSCFCLGGTKARRLASAGVQKA